jgi:hypothetical protein
VRLFIFVKAKFKFEYELYGCEVSEQAITKPQYSNATTNISASNFAAWLL